MHEYFVANLGSPLDDECQKAIQSVKTDFKEHDMCMSIIFLIYGQETVTDLPKQLVLQRKFG